MIDLEYLSLVRGCLENPTEASRRLALSAWFEGKGEPDKATALRAKEGTWWLCRGAYWRPGADWEDSICLVEDHASALPGLEDGRIHCCSSSVFDRKDGRWVCSHCHFRQG